MSFFSNHLRPKNMRKIWQHPIELPIKWKISSGLSLRHQKRAGVPVKVSSEFCTTRCYHNVMSKTCQWERNLGPGLRIWKPEGCGMKTLWVHPEQSRARGSTVRIDNLDQSGIGIIVKYAVAKQAAGKIHNNLLFRVALRPP